MRRVLHVCPACERVFDSPTVRLPGDKPTKERHPESTCDWGDCEQEATGFRHSPRHGWLPVCEDHSGERGAPFQNMGPLVMPTSLEGER